MHRRNPTALTARMRAYALERELPLHHRLYRAIYALEYAASQPDCPLNLRQKRLEARLVWEQCKLLEREDKKGRP